jgi:hypothetical protein
MTFQEKSAIVMTGALLLVYGSYFSVVLRWMAVSPVDEIAYQPLMIVAIVPLVILATLSHIVLAIINPKEANAYDERDRAITIRAEQISAYVLAVGVFVGLVLAMGGIAHFYIANSLLLAWVLAEITDRVTRVVLYRRGA